MLKASSTSGAGPQRRDFYSYPPLLHPAAHLIQSLDKLLDSESFVFSTQLKT